MDRCKICGRKIDLPVETIRHLTAKKVNQLTDYFYQEALREPYCSGYCKSVAYCITGMRDGLKTIFFSSHTWVQEIMAYFTSLDEHQQKHYTNDVRGLERLYITDPELWSDVERGAAEIIVNEYRKNTGKFMFPDSYTTCGGCHRFMPQTTATGVKVNGKCVEKNTKVHSFTPCCRDSTASSAKDLFFQRITEAVSSVFSTVVDESVAEHIASIRSHVVIPKVRELEVPK